jgi:hypothetical protein
MATEMHGALHVIIIAVEYPAVFERYFIARALWFFIEALRVTCEIRLLRNSLITSFTLRSLVFYR